MELANQKEVDKVAEYITAIKKYRVKADRYSDDSPASLIKRVQLLTQAHTLIGRVSAYLDGEYRRTYSLRKRVYAETKRDAPRGDKENTAELAILDLRDQEAEAYERMQLWRNEFKSLSEELYEMRLRVRVDMNLLNHTGV